MRCLLRWLPRKREGLRMCQCRDSTVMPAPGRRLQCEHLVRVAVRQQAGYGFDNLERRFYIR